MVLGGDFKHFVQHSFIYGIREGSIGRHVGVDKDEWPRGGGNVDGLYSVAAIGEHSEAVGDCLLP